MSRPQAIAQRVATFLQKQNSGYCETCLIERLLVASRAAMKAALAMECFAVRTGICPDCKTRKQIVTYRARDVAA